MQRSQDQIGVRQFVGLKIDRAPTIAIRMIERMVKEKAAAGKEKEGAAI